MKKFTVSKQGPYLDTPKLNNLHDWICNGLFHYISIHWLDDQILVPPLDCKFVWYLTPYTQLKDYLTPHCQDTEFLPLRRNYRKVAPLDTITGHLSGVYTYLIE